MYHLLETNSLWELGQTPLSEKLQNDTSADRVPTYFQNRQRKYCIFLLLKSSKIKPSSNFSQLQSSTAIIIKQKNRERIPGFWNTCTSEEPQAIKNTWHEWTNLFYRYWEVHSEGACGQPAEKNRPETKNCWAIDNLSPKISMELICYFLVAEKFKPSGCQTFLNWKCQQLCSNSKSTENNCRKNVAWIKRVMIFEKSQDKRITLF